MTRYILIIICLILAVLRCGAFVLNRPATMVNQPMLTLHSIPPCTYSRERGSNGPNKVQMSIGEREVSQWAENLVKGTKNLLTGKGWNGNGLMSKEQLAKLGLNMLLAYGFVSNISYISCVIIAWVAHGRKYGLSPLAPGQWKSFLLIYTGLWAANNIIRPARFSVSLLISPLFERMIDFFHRKLALTKTQATAVVVVLVNVLGTLSYLTFGLLLATKLTGVPLFP